MEGSLVMVVEGEMVVTPWVAFTVTISEEPEMEVVEAMEDSLAMVAEGEMEEAADGHKISNLPSLKEKMKTNSINMRRINI